MVFVSNPEYYTGNKLQVNLTINPSTLNWLKTIIKRGYKEILILQIVVQILMSTNQMCGVCFYTYTSELILLLRFYYYSNDS